jgi:hypothetical protein
VRERRRGCSRPLLQAVVAAVLRLRAREWLGGSRVGEQRLSSAGVDSGASAPTVGLRRCARELVAVLGMWIRRGAARARWIWVGRRLAAEWWRLGGGAHMWWKHVGARLWMVAAGGS